MVSLSAICAGILVQNFYIVQYHVCLPSLHSAWVSDQQSVAVPQQPICPETYCCCCAWVNLQVVWPWPQGCSSYPCGGLRWKRHDMHSAQNDFFSKFTTVELLFCDQLVYKKFLSEIKERRCLNWVVNVRLPKWDTLPNDLTIKQRWLFNAVTVKKRFHSSHCFRWKSLRLH